MAEMRGNQRTGGEIIVDALRSHGVDTVFCVPGESYLATIDAFYGARDSIRVVPCRQEGGAAYMADADGKLTGRPGVLFVTRGPGATNASVGIHTAFQDSTPLVVFIGQVPRSSAERFAFQEIDFRRMFGPLCKWVAQIDEAARVPEMVSRAFHLATSGRPGPVILAIPEDMQTELAGVADAARFRPARAAPAREDMVALRAMLSGAKSPLMIVGGSGWTPEAVADIRAFAEANALPVATSFRRQDLFDNRHPNHAGVAGLGMNPALAARIRDADVLLLVGCQANDVLTDNYTLMDLPTPRQALVHVLSGADELGRIYQPTMPIAATMPTFAAAARAMDPIGSPAWGDAVKTAHSAYEDWIKGTPVPGRVSLTEVVHHLNEHLPDDAIVATGAGNFSLWIHRYYRYRGYPTQLSPINGSMGYGLPAAIAAKLRHPDRIVVGFSGDGDFLMTGQELATAVGQKANIVSIVVNNGLYGTIRMHQENHYPGRPYATDLANPDFADLARAYGAHGETVEDTADFADAFEHALAAGKPALIDLRVDPEAVTPTATLTGLRDKALGKA